MHRKHAHIISRSELKLKTKGELTTVISLINSILLTDEVQKHKQKYIDKLALIVEASNVFIFRHSITFSFDMI